MDLMNRHDYFYELPPERIAQEPIEPRDHSRMLVLDRSSGSLTDKHFYDLTDFLRPGDCLILNDSRVLPARLYGHRKGTGAAVELLLLTHKGTDEWEVLAGPGRKARPGDTLVFGGGLLEADVLDVINDGNRLVRFRYAGSFYPLLEQLGQMPLPHYITHQLENKERRLMEIMECEILADGTRRYRPLFQYQITENRVEDGKFVIVGHHRQINPISDSLARRLMENGMPQETLAGLLNVKKDREGENG